MSGEREAQYDYIIVGSGAGGGPLAGNLARAGMQVLLLEAGGRGDSANYPVPVLHPRATEDPALKWDFFVRHYEDVARSRRDEKFVEAEDGVLYPRSGALGGCTAHHAMITIYPHNRDWQHIAELTGDDSWGPDAMRGYFERLERNGHRKVRRLFAKLLGVNFGRRGYDGWLPTDIASPALALSSPRLLHLLVSAVKAADPRISPSLWRRLVRIFRSVGGLLDPNDWKLVRKNAQGVRFAPLSTEAGRRRGTREYIDAVAESHPDHLHVKLNALVTRVLFDDRKRAIGVAYQEGKGLYGASPGAAASDPANAPAERREYARREVILCGGAFNTPQLLMLSGIGPRDELERHGIEVRADRPGVGSNLQDRYEVGVISKLKQPFRLLDGARFCVPEPGETPDPQYRDWLQGEGAYTTNGAVVSIIKRSTPDRPLPDLFCFGLVGPFSGYYPGYSEDAYRQPYFTWAILKAHTENRAGTVRLRSRDPRDTPLINFRYFREGSDDKGEDLEAVVRGIEFVRTLNRASADLFEEEVLPGAGVAGDEAVRQFVEDNAWGHHASCTCAIGHRDDEMAVVDSRFRVIGVSGLRVVDASVFPRIPGFFIVLPIYMVSEKASDVILEDARAEAGGP